MNGKQYKSVLLVAALLGACLGGGAVVIKSIVGNPDKPLNQTQLTSTASVVSTIKPATTVTQTVVSIQSITTLTTIVVTPSGPVGTGVPPTFKQPNTAKPPQSSVTTP
jgi:hypothetical protein